MGGFEGASAFGESAAAAAAATVQENVAELQFGPEFEEIQILSNAQVAVILQLSADSAVQRDEELNEVYRKTQKYVNRFNSMNNPEKEHQEIVDELDNLQEWVFGSKLFYFCWRLRVSSRIEWFCCCWVGRFYCPWYTVVGWIDGTPILFAAMSTRMGILLFTTRVSPRLVLYSLTFDNQPTPTSLHCNDNIFWITIHYQISLSALTTFRKETDDGEELELHGGEVSALMNLVATDTMVEEAVTLIPSLSRFSEAAIDEILDLIRSTMMRIVS